MSAWTPEREAELRSSGWSDSDIRDYKRGWEKGLEGDRFKLPPQQPRPEPRVQQMPTTFHHPRNSERYRWQAETFAGHLSQLLPPADDDAEALAEARRLREHREFCYETEPPPLRAFLAAVRHGGPRGVTVSGTTAECAQILRSAGIAVRVGVDYEPAALANDAKVTRPASLGASA